MCTCVCVYVCVCAVCVCVLCVCVCVCVYMCMCVCVCMDVCAVHTNHSVAVTLLLRLCNVTCCTLTSELYHALQFVSRK